MSHQKLSTALADLNHRLSQTERLAIAAEQWYSNSANFSRRAQKFTLYHRDLIAEVAFLQAFLSWESFLEETFVLYAWGKIPPKRRSSPKCVYPPPHSRELVEQILVPEGKKYIEWTEVNQVTNRAERFFVDGNPYCRVMRPNQSRLENMKFIRNAIAHASSYSQQKFQELVRNELGTFPPHLTIGGFLLTTMPGSSPPTSFFENYLSYLYLMADDIVPS
jgi:hypothetical protein